MDKPLILAYYLPQFHPFKENDEWWGKGFTEWTNVGKAKPLFKGHNQPRVPTELGYYDLRMPIIREQQAELAKEAGVNGFCYWHYWFAPSKQLMNNIIDEVAASGKPDFPFCLGWANESWKAKQWNVDGSGDKILIEQTYGGETDYRAHYEYVRELFKNKSYIRIDGKPFFLVYKPEQHPEMQLFISKWNKWIMEDGIAQGVYFVATNEIPEHKDTFLRQGFSAVTPAHGRRIFSDRVGDVIFSRKFKLKEKIRKYMQRPIIYDAHVANSRIVNAEFDGDERVIPFLLPQWDHTSRSGINGYMLYNSNKNTFKEQAKKVLEIVSKKKNKIIMLKSWNEWGEGNYMEPDISHGKSYIEALKEAIEESELI